jgi:threonine/homoserine/homoserine lactone efflux protein
MNFATPTAIFVSSFIIGLSGAMMPGPLLAVAVRDATRRGFVAAPLLVLGHALLEACLLVLLLAGLGEWVKGEAVTSVIALIGCAALVWMAAGMVGEIRTLRFAGADAGGSAALRSAPPGRADGYWRPVVDGAVVSLSNPYWAIWWATIGLGYLVLSRGIGTAGVAAFFFGHILSDFAWYLFVGATVAMGRARLTDRIYRGIVGGCAAFLFLFALSFGYYGVSGLLRLP